MKSNQLQTSLHQYSHLPLKLIIVLTILTRFILGFTLFYQILEYFLIVFLLYFLLQSLKSYLSPNYEKITEKLQNNDLKVILDGIVSLRKALTSKMDPIEKIVNQEIIDGLFQCTSSTNDEILKETLMCISIIFRYFPVILGTKMLLRLLNLLENQNEEIQIGSIELLSNIMDSYDYEKLFLLNNGIAEKLVKILESTKNFEVVKRVSEAVKNIFHNLQDNHINDVEILIEKFSFLLKFQNNEILSNIAEAIYHYTNGKNNNNEKRYNRLLNDKIDLQFIEILKNNEEIDVTYPIINVIGNILTGDDNKTRIIINSGFIGICNKLLRNNEMKIRKQTLWSLSNIAASNSENIQVIFDHDLYKNILNLAKIDDHDVKKEVLFVISNTIIFGSPTQISNLIKEDCIPILISFFDSKVKKHLITSLKTLDLLFDVIFHFTNSIESKIPSNFHQS